MQCRFRDLEINMVQNLSHYVSISTMWYLLQCVSMCTIIEGEKKERKKDRKEKRERERRKERKKERNTYRKIDRKIERKKYRQIHSSKDR